MQDEIWKDIPGYDGYQASSLGRIRSVDKIISAYRIIDASNKKYAYKKTLKGKILSPSVDRHGYFRYNISGQNVFVHRLVCLAFHGEPQSDGMHTAHLDGSRTNNVPGNLAWKTPAENAQDAIRHGRLKSGTDNSNAKLTPDSVLYIRAMYESGAASQGKLAKLFGVSQQTIGSIVNGKTWRHVRNETHSSSWLAPSIRASRHLR
jgi:DNA-binding XRE family transcriptional regulator